MNKKQEKELIEKEVCKNCGDNIVGEKYSVNFLYNKRWNMIVDFGCLLSLQKKSIIRSYKKFN